MMVFPRTSNKSGGGRHASLREEVASYSFAKPNLKFCLNRDERKNGKGRGDIGPGYKVQASHFIYAL